MQDVRIFPIFNQAAPNVWHDFAHICASTMLTNYHYEMSDEEIADQQEKDAEAWLKRRLKFAFGAYDDAKMIGFIQGYVSAATAHVDCLYVLHPYQKMRVGHRLLYAAEKAVASYATKVELISLRDACDFYKSHDYYSPNQTNWYWKNLGGKSRCDSVPVFKCYAWLTRQCRALAPDFNQDIVNVLHEPMWAYFDESSKLRGFVASDGAGDCILRTDKSFGISDIVENTLGNIFNRYIVQQKNINQR